MRTKFIAVILLWSQFSFSQFIPDEAALWARTGVTGTARTVGSAGAYGSVGADLGCITVNPAGLGLYRSTDFAITPSFQIGNDESVYDGNHTTAHKLTFNFGQGGFVFTKIYKNANDNSQMGFSGHPLKSLSFALNFQQTKTFDRNQNYSVNSSANSLLDGYAYILNSYQQPVTNFPPEIQIASGLGFIGNNPNGSYFSGVKGPVSQSGSIATRGAINRIDFAFGGNLMDKLYFGIDLAVPIISYSVNNNFVETPLTSTGGNQLQDYNFNSTTGETGFGFNGIIGLIYRPTSWMRLGAAYHLPTWYSMTENYSIGGYEDTAGIPYSFGPYNAPSYKYGVRTPMKGSFGASFYYKQYGFISIDYDVQNLGSTLIHIPNDSFQIESSYNTSTKKTYTYSHTVHAGLEAAIKIVRLRAGYSFSSSPYKKGQELSTGYNDVRNAFTAGMGVRLKHFYADVAYVYGWSKDATNQLTNIYYNVNSTYTSSTVMLTIGWKFESGVNNTKSAQQKSQPQPRYTPPPVDNEPRY